MLRSILGGLGSPWMLMYSPMLLDQPMNIFSKETVEDSFLEKWTIWAPDAIIAAHHCRPWCHQCAGSAARAVPHAGECPP